MPIPNSCRTEFLRSRRACKIKWRFSIRYQSPDALSRVGINPTALAYNFLSSTLVTLNQLSQTMTVIDFLAKQVRAVFPITPSSQFGVDIDSQTNLAVVADSSNSRILLLPLPQ